MMVEEEGSLEGGFRRSEGKAERTSLQSAIQGCVSLVMVIVMFLMIVLILMIVVVEVQSAMQGLWNLYFLFSFLII